MLNSLVRVSRRGEENHFVIFRSHWVQQVLVNSLDAFAPRTTKIDATRPQRSICKQTEKCEQVITDFLRFPFSNFRYSLTLFSKFFASFPHGTCTLSVSHQYLALDGIYHPLRAAIPNNSTRRLPAREARRTGVSPSLLPRSKGLRPAANASVSRPQFGAKRRFRMGYSRFSRPY